MKPTPPSSGSLTQPEHWFRILTETSPAAVMVIRDTILFANKAAERLTGYALDELQEMTTDQVLLAERKDGAAKIRCKDGKNRWVSLQSGSIDLDWEPATVVSMVDLTSQLDSEKERSEIERRLELAQRAARWVAWEWVPESDKLITSPYARDLFGLDGEDFVTTGSEFLALIHPQDRDSFRRSLQELLEGDDNLSVEVRCVSSRGEVRWLSENAVAVRNGTTRVERVVGIAHDITDRKIAENALFQEKDRAFVTLSSIADGVIRTDARGTVDYLNPVAQRLTGWTLAEAYGHPANEVYEIVDDETGKRVLDPIQHCLEEQREVVFLGQRRLVRRDGRAAPVHDSAAPIRDRQGRVTGAILVFRDLTQVREVEAEMQHLATHDPLTGLINRREFERRLHETLSRPGATTYQSALCNLDLDAFKVVNDSCGHAAGDQLIRQIASVLENQTGPADLLARLGGDEFAIFLRNCTPEEAANRAQAMCDAIHDYRFHWSGRTFTPRVSLGLVPLQGIGAGADALLGAADAACFVAKEHGGGRIHVFQPGDRAIAERFGQMQWISRIQRAFDDNRFCLWHQNIQPLRPDIPELPLNELFVRLIDEEGAIVAPGAFIPAAERFGLIDSIDRWVVRSALRLLAAGSRSTPVSTGRVAINISGQSLGTDGFLEYITDELQQTGIRPDRVFFEITETSAIANLRNAMRFISVLKEMGCLFVLDDFGQGLSSFGYLKSLPLDFLKIDGAFVREMTQDPIQAALVSSIREIGEVMGLRTIAESVEDKATLTALEHLGVDYVQGYYVHRPQPLTGASEPPVRRQSD